MFEEGLLGQFYDASFGLVYPVLNALLKQEYVSVTQVAQEKWSDKKTNSLTPVGLGFFKRALVKPPTKDKIHPRIKETAKRLWIIYFGLTSIETIVLMLPN